MAEAAADDNEDTSGCRSTDKDERKDPQWLESVRGESPLLSHSQCKFIAGIRSRIRHKKQSAVKISGDQIFAVKEQADLLKDYFEQVVQQLKSNPSSRQCFKEKYPEWSKCRIENVNRLRKIADSIDTVNKNCRRSKIVGTSVTLIGSAISVFAGNTDEFVVGSLMQGFGSLTNAGTNVVEKNWLKKKIKKSKKIIQQDKENLKHLVAYLVDAKLMQEALDKIKSFNNKKNLLTVAEKLQNVFKKNLSGRQKEEEIQMTLKSLDCSPVVRNEISDIVGLLVAAMMLFQRYYPEMRLAYSSYKFMSKLQSSFNYFRGCHVAVDAVDKFNRNGGLTNSQKFLVGAEMLLDIASIILVATEDSKNIESQNIRKIADKLEREASILNNLYKKMNSMDTQDIREDNFDGNEQMIGQSKWYMDSNV